MSNPQNILANYRTYSYHHVLMLANNTKAAQAIAQSSEIVNFTRESSDEQYEVRQVPGMAGGQYIILINGMSDARYFIQSAKWSTMMAPTSVGEVNHTSSVAVDGEIEIFEPYGFRFMKLIADSCTKLNADPNGLIFVLKTIFIGHTHDGTTENIVTIKPLIFWTYDIQTATTEEGTQYNIALVSVSDGAAKLPQISNIGQGISLPIEKGQTLRSVLKTLEDRINLLYENRRKKFVNKYNQQIEGIDNLKKVQYRIELGEGYDESYIVGDNTKESQQNTGDDDPIINAGKKVSIEGMIDKIMKSCSKVLEEGGGDSREKFYYKINSTIDSDEENFVVRYKVNRHKLIVDTLAAEKAGELEPEEGKTIEFNYVYTGNNIDILEFDMRMEMGLAFLQAITTTENLPDSKQTLSKGNANNLTGKGNATSANPAPKLRENIPLYIGSFSDDAMIRNLKNPITAETFNGLIDKYAMYNNIEVQMTIHGNPQLLADLMVIPDTFDRTDESVIIPGITIAGDWQSAPPYVKVNIKMPEDPNHPEGPYEDFWYSGYYRIFEVNNIFDTDGIFKQELSLFSLPQMDPSTSEKQIQNNQDVNSEPFEIVIEYSSLEGEDATEQTAQQIRQSVNNYSSDD